MVVRVTGAFSAKKEVRDYNVARIGNNGEQKQVRKSGGQQNEKVDRLFITGRIHGLFHGTSC